MDTRNTWQAGLIERVRNGMRVVDADGRELGEVAYVQMGDPEAATTQGTGPATTNIVDAFVNVTGGEPDLPEPLRSRFLRHGFVKVDGPDLADTDRYVRGDQIAAGGGDVVTLTVLREELAVEE